jgi:D-alanine-D-alanine ligase
MTIKVDPEWWKKLFDELYLITDSRSVCDDGITRLEVDLICDMLSIRPGQKILDLCCGHGRHSLELFARGFTECTIVDYSPFLIDHAKKEASRRNYNMEIIQADARNTGLSSRAFDIVIIMGNSLGYINESESDFDILLEAFRVLRKGGKVLVDVVNGASICETFSSLAWHEIGEDIVVCREREIENNRVNTREVVLSKREGLIRDQTYSIRFYTPESLMSLLEDVGFCSVTVCTDFSPHRKKADYGCMNNRMIVTGNKL